MRNRTKKIICVISTVSLMTSMTGCFDFFSKAISTENRDAIAAAIAEGNFVTEWTDEIPDGMEVQYVLAKSQKVNGYDYLSEMAYGYDSQGRLAVVQENLKNGYTRNEIAYNDEGQVVLMERTTGGNSGSVRIPDIEYTFEYNADGQIVYLKEVIEDKSYEIEFTYENGHLVSRTDQDGKQITYEYNFDELPYYETLVVINDPFDVDSIEYVKRFYNQSGLILSQEGQDYEITYEYSNGELTGSTKMTEGGFYCTYDSNGNLIHTGSGYGADEKMTQDYEYNEHNDLIHYEVNYSGEPSNITNNSYVYDSNGNMITMTSEVWTSFEGKEETKASTTTYTYDEHGLLTVEEEVYSDGSVSYTTIYYYKAVLVPA